MRFTTAAAITAFAGMLWFSVGREQLVPTTPLLAAPAPADSSEAAVLIIVVGESGALERVRQRISREHILSDEPDAIALAGGRIFATRIEAASAPLSKLGWAERRLEIVDPASRPSARASASAASNPATAGSDLATLAKKETLTLNEALRLLDDHPGAALAPPQPPPH